MGEEEEGKETYVKLSVIPVIKRDTLVTTAPSTHGINNRARITGTNDQVREEK